VHQRQQDPPRARAGVAGFGSDLDRVILRRVRLKARSTSSPRANELT
jgi:hypothetical protein